MRVATGLISLSKRELIRFLVVWQQTLVPPILLSVLFIFIFGLSVGRNLSLGYMDVSYLKFIVPGLLTMHLVSGSFENTSTSLFIARWHNHIQEILLSPLSYLEMVTGLWVGGVARATITTSGVLLVAQFFEPICPAHPALLLFFVLSITTIFSCAGMLAALWADNWGMLSVWNTYLITPMVYLGGVFNPSHMLPEKVRIIAFFNPMFYLVSGVRYSVLGIAEAPVAASVAIAFLMAAGLFALATHLFRIGYKLRS